MPLSMISFAINFMIGMYIWASELSTLMKVVFTIILVVKFMLYFYSVFISDSDGTKNVGTIVCALIDIFGIGYMAASRVWSATILFGIALLLLVVWRVLCSFNFSKRGDTKK